MKGKKSFKIRGGLEEKGTLPYWVPGHIIMIEKTVHQMVRIKANISQLFFCATGG